jgi:hypothetical protein
MRPGRVNAKYMALEEGWMSNNLTRTIRIASYAEYLSLYAELRRSCAPV